MSLGSCLGVESSDDEGMGSSPSSESDSEGFSTDVSDQARERVQELCSLAVRESAPPPPNRRPKSADFTNLFCQFVGFL